MALHRRILLPDRKGCDVHGPKGCDADLPSVSDAPPPSVSDAPPPSVSAVPDIPPHNRHLFNVVIIAVPIIAAVFFLSLTYYAVLRRRRRRRRHPLLHPAVVPAGSGAASPPSDDDGFSEDGEGPHHVWYIRTVGLDEATIGSIAVTEYKAGGGLLGAADCSVCLGEFEDGERVRLLPKCGHAFHIPCIDTWLRAHVNCPLCRADIIDPPADPTGAAPPPPAATTVGTISVDDSSSSVPVDNPDTGIQALESDNGLRDVEEEDSGTETGVGIEILLDRFPESSELPVPSDLGEDVLQPVRRSVSMDSPYLGILPIRVEPEEEDSGEERKDPNFGEEQRIKNGGKQGNFSKQGSLRKGHLEIERSLSSSGTGFFSRYGRVARNSILPL